MIVFGDREPRWVSVFTVDPGERTGWAWLCYERSRLATDGAHGAVKIGLELSYAMCMQGEMPSVKEDEATDEIRRYVRRSSERAASHVATDVSTVCIIEDFTLRERTMDSSLLSPVRLGAKVAYGMYLDEVPVYWQSPSDAKSTITDDRLQRWGLWRKGAPHANDAMRHLILWLRKEINGEH